MKPYDVFTYRRKADRIAIGELLELEGRLLTLYTLRFVEELTLLEITDKMGMSYSAVSKMSMELNHILEELDL